jgi:poly(hydroxyalkanoate) depolymerase family esterase
MILFVLLAGTAYSFSSTLTKTTTTITSALNPSTYGQAVTFTATVTSAQGAPPNGEVITFEEGKNILGTATLTSGTAKFTTSTLSTGGSDSISAVYGGDSTFAASTAKAVSQVVDAAATTTRLTSSQNPANVGASVTFTATVSPQFSGTVTGRVSFYNGTKKLVGVLLSNGVGTYTTTDLAVGTDSITASFNGTGTFNTSTSNVVSQAMDTGTTTTPTMIWDGITRYYEVFVPTVLPSNPPMLLMLHGTSYDKPPANPSTENWYWQSLADAYGFILVQPASTYNSKSGQWNWNSYFMDASFQGAPPDDSGFLRQLIVNLKSEYNVNPNMVYVTGFSSGAQMTERVGVELSDLVAAIAPTSGQMEGQQAAPPPVEVPGAIAAPVSVQEWHGTEDTELPPCNYGTTIYSSITYYLDTVDDTFNYWVQQNKCTALQTSQTLCTDSAPTANMSGNIATSCSEGNVEVQFIWEPKIAHGWVAGNNTARWQFLSSHPKASDPDKAVRQRIDVLSR